MSTNWHQIVINYHKGNISFLDRIKGLKIAHSVLKTVKLISRRSFYLFELFKDNPHLFIAIELNNNKLIVLLKILTRYLNFMHKGEIFDNITLREKTKDYKNGELFLSLLSGWCNGLTNHYEDLFEQQAGRKKGLKQINHILHCCMNATFGTREAETSTYRKMIKWYGIPN